MKRLALAAGVALLAMTGLVATPAASESNLPPEVTQPDPCSQHPRPPAEQRQLARLVFAYSRWRDRTPVGPGYRRQMIELRRCAPRIAHRAMREAWRKAKEMYFRNRAYRIVAPYPGFQGEGYWLTWLAVPSWVVAAETRGYTGEGRWLATNSIGACGPYQLLGHTSCASSSWRDKLRMHRVAAGLPRGSWAVGY